MGVIGAITLRWIAVRDELTTAKIGEADARAGRAEAKAERTQELVIDLQERVHTKEIRDAERSSELAAFKTVIESRLGAQDSALERIELKLGTKVSRSTFRAAFGDRIPERDDSGSDPPEALPPMRPRQNTRR
jgi:hypothetical protein